jgi:hypothetical protein
MAVPAQIFRPHSIPAAVSGPPAGITAGEPMRLPVLPPPSSSEDDVPVQAVEFEAVISPGRHVMLPQGQSLKFSPALVGRTVTLWVSHRNVHVLLDG